MSKFIKLLTSTVLLASVLFVARPIHAQQQAPASKLPVTTVVTVLGPNYTAPPALGK